jgi:hypothetical protein
MWPMCEQGAVTSLPPAMLSLWTESGGAILGIWTQSVGRNDAVQHS